MCERDRISGSNAEGATARKLVHRSRDEREPHAVQVAKRRCDGPWQGAIHERLKEDRFKPVLAVMQRDELVEHGLGGFGPRPPSLDACDLRRRSVPQRLFHETFLRRGMKVKRSRRHMRAPGNVRHPKGVISAPGDFT